jgi:predicted signal transduction protein with EAL and GGDEF domain
LLQSAAKRLQACVRNSDTVSRQGGDEFVVLLAEVEAVRDAALTAQKLIEAMAAPHLIGGHRLHVTLSIGISLYPDDAADTEALLRHADVAMYRAKAAGGGRLVFHERSDALGSRRASLTAQLRRALDAGEMEIHYQPVWSLTPARTISGLEALLRWRHPDRGLLTADAFMSLAERSSAGDDLMALVFHVCWRQGRAWQAEDLAPAVGINIAPHQLLVPDFAMRLAAQVGEAGLSPRNFVLELTESAWTVDSAETLAVIEDVRTAGFPMALDDFGAGYSSLSRLLDLGFDVIKVDGGMLRDVPGDVTAVNLLRAVFDVASACGTDIVAEGVETEAQLEFLLSHGISRAQGYLLGEPLPAAEMTPLLRRHLVTGPPPRRGRRTDSGRV